LLLQPLTLALSYVGIVLNHRRAVTVSVAKIMNSRSVRAYQTQSCTAPRLRPKKLVAPGRFELPTSGLGNRCSIHLSYGATLNPIRAAALCGLLCRCHWPLPYRGAFNIRDSPSVYGEKSSACNLAIPAFEPRLRSLNPPAQYSCPTRAPQLRLPKDQKPSREMVASLS
jgi:hypothetical protein